jgi:hypothetical protein
MKVSELIKKLEDFDPDLPVYVASSDHDFDWMTLHEEFISEEYVTSFDEDASDDIEIKALCLGDGHQ